MKKVLIAVVTAGLMATSAMALDGSVTEVRIDADGDIYVKVDTYNKPLVGTPEAIKAMYAAALTALSTSRPVTVASGTYLESAIGWSLFIAK